MPESPSTVRRALAALTLAVVLIAGGCSGERPTLADEVEDTTTTTEAPTTTTTTVPEGVEVATAKRSSIDVFSSQDATDPDRQIVAGVDSTASVSSTVTR